MKRKGGGSIYGPGDEPDQFYEPVDQERGSRQLTPAEMLNDWQPAEAVVGRENLTPDELFEEQHAGGRQNHYEVGEAEPTTTAGSPPAEELVYQEPEGQQMHPDYHPSSDYGQTVTDPADSSVAPVYTYSPSDESEDPELLEQTYTAPPTYAAAEIQPEPVRTERAAAPVASEATPTDGAQVAGWSQAQAPQQMKAAVPFYDYADDEDEHEGINFASELRHLKEAVQTLWAIIRGFFTDRPMQSLKPAGLSNNLYVWALTSVAVIFLGALGGFIPNPYLELSYGRFYAKSLLQMLVSLLLPAAFYCLVKLFKQTDLKLNSLLNVATTTVLPVMMVRLVSILFARLLPILVAPLVATASFIHVFLLHQALKRERFGKTNGYYWLMLLYIFIYLLVTQLLVPVV